MNFQLFFRSVWDDRMIEGFNIEQIDDNNDVGKMINVNI
jgi:hypothetical protein